MTCIMDREVCPPWGLFGGQYANHCRVIVNPESDHAVTYQKGMRVLIHAGDLVRVESGGGGGWGDVRERDPEHVCYDVLAGYVSLETARRHYGVVLDPETLEIDRPATEHLRAKL